MTLPPSPPGPGCDLSNYSCSVIFTLVLRKLVFNKVFPVLGYPRRHCATHAINLPLGDVVLAFDVCHEMYFRLGKLPQETDTSPSPPLTKEFLSQLRSHVELSSWVNETSRPMQYGFGSFNLTDEMWSNESDLAALFFVVFLFWLVQCKLLKKGKKKRWLIWV